MYSRPVRSSRPWWTRYAGSAALALPVTGSSGTPAAGAKQRMWTANSPPSTKAKAATPVTVGLSSSERRHVGLQRCYFGLLLEADEEPVWSVTERRWGWRFGDRATERLGESGRQFGVLAHQLRLRRLHPYPALRAVVPRSAAEGYPPRIPGRGGRSRGATMPASSTAWHEPIVG